MRQVGLGRFHWPRIPPIRARAWCAVIAAMTRRFNEPSSAPTLMRQEGARRVKHQGPSGPRRSLRAHLSFAARPAHGRLHGRLVSAQVPRPCRCLCSSPCEGGHSGALSHPDACDCAVCRDDTCNDAACRCYARRRVHRSNHIAANTALSARSPAPARRRCSSHLVQGTGATCDPDDQTMVNNAPVAAPSAQNDGTNFPAAAVIAPATKSSQHAATASNGRRSRARPCAGLHESYCHYAENGTTRICIHPRRRESILRIEGATGHNPNDITDG